MWELMNSVCTMGYDEFMNYSSEVAAPVPCRAVEPLRRALVRRMTEWQLNLGVAVEAMTIMSMFEY